MTILPNRELFMIMDYRSLTLLSLIEAISGNSQKKCVEELRRTLLRNHQESRIRYPCPIGSTMTIY